MPSTNKGFAALTASPGARACYDRHRAAGATHHQALRTLANRLVGILHGCLRTEKELTPRPAAPTYYSLNPEPVARVASRPCRRLGFRFLSLSKDRISVRRGSRSETRLGWGAKREP